MVNICTWRLCCKMASSIAWRLSSSVILHASNVIPTRVRPRREVRFNEMVGFMMLGNMECYYHIEVYEGNIETHGSDITGENWGRRSLLHFIPMFLPESPLNGRELLVLLMLWTLWMEMKMHTPVVYCIHASNYTTTLHTFSANHITLHSFSAHRITTLHTSLQTT